MDQNARFPLFRWITAVFTITFWTKKTLLLLIENIFLPPHLQHFTNRMKICCLSLLVTFFCVIITESLLKFSSYSFWKTENSSFSTARGEGLERWKEQDRITVAVQKETCLSLWVQVGFVTRPILSTSSSFKKQCDWSIK